jgi:hypothetical protein
MKNEEDRKSYRKIYLTRSDLRKLFNIPSNVEISSVQVDNDPMSVSVMLTSDYESMPWEEEFWGGDKRYSEEGIEDNESRILNYGEWGKWQSQ